ncbi:hypothetical protein [Leifsonia sp. NPDC080035]|uniref:Secreted protein n=1 Tax=Leifsonia sp. NPDC080035 TaxID=3143936 RepID=A0AAU7G8W1_9MICO
MRGSVAVGGRRWRWAAIGVVAAAYVAAVIFAAATHQPLDDTAPNTTIITAKTFIPSHEDCGGPSCVDVPDDWQFDIMTGRRANTIDVSRQTYDEYSVGDTYTP